MIRQLTGRTIRFLLCAGVAAGLCAGCTTNRGAGRSLRISTIDTDPRQLTEKSRSEKSSAVAKKFSDEDRDDKPTPSRDSKSRTGIASLAGDSEQKEKTTEPDEASQKAAQRAADRRELSPDRIREIHGVLNAGHESAEDEILSILTAGYEEPKAPADAAEVADPPEELPLKSNRFQVPPELPGSEAPPLRVPPVDPNQAFEERRELIERLYGTVPEMPLFLDEDPLAQVWTLPDLENMAWENHPALMQAAADMEVARGGMIQAGLHPNPTFGWEQDTIGPGIQGYKGPYMTQEIVTGGKLKLSRSAAAMDFENAKQAYQRMKIDIATRVRGAYYDLLVSRQRRRMLAALARLCDEIYRAQIELVAGGQAAAYEPLQVRVFAVQARNDVIEAHNSVIAAGRRLGAAVGMPDSEEFHIAGQAEDAPANIAYHSAKAYLMENHTELRSARNRIVQAQYLSRLEYIRPRIPNLTFYGTYQHAYGVPPFINSYNFQAGAPIPIFDRNQGNILATQSTLISNERAFGAMQNDLIGQLAAVLARYATARAQAENYRRQMLPDQVRTYRGIYSRYREAGPGNDNINFGDVIVAQQTLATVVSGYADVLSQLWQSYIDVADLLQMEDLRALGAWFGAGN
jgi:outer membrane protein, heavy metal efflux system